MRFRTWVAPSIAALLLLAVAWPTAHVELGLGAGPALPVGLAACLPVVFVVAAPAVGWLLSALGALVLVLIDVPAGHAVPVVHLVVLLGLLAVVVVRSARWVVATTAVVTIVGTAGVALGHGAVDLAVIGVLGVVAVLVVALLVRTLVRSRLALAESEETSERERARSAVLEERARIARELHDVVAHSMSMVAVRAETARYRLPDLDDDTVDELAAIAEAARRSLGDVRGVLGVLRTTHASDAGPPPPQPTPADVQRLLDDTAGAGMLLHVASIGDSSRTGPAAVVCLYRVLAESLANASRHAAGAPVGVTVDHGADAVRVEVVNGPGRDGGPGSGLGVTGMRERATALGGELTAGPTGDGGFAVTARLPSTGATVEVSAPA